MKERLQQIEEVIAQGPYKANWSSLSQMQVPNWFSKAKFGIFIHWGLYSIPAFQSEWYSRNMYIKDCPSWEHHRKTYGDHRQFGYKDFIPLFTAEKFDPEQWASIIEDCGARYVFPVAEHHDGFQMYKSEISKFNAFDMGPHRDILGELKTAFENHNLTFCTSTHRAEHWFFMGHGKEFESDIHEPLKRGDFYWPAMPEPEDHFDVHSQPYPTEEYLQDWLIRTCEIIDQYQPKILYFDWWIQHESFNTYLQKLAAYYYNRGVQWNQPTAICYKQDAMVFGSGIIEIERGVFQDIKPFTWQTDTAIARNSWGYIEGLQYKTAREIISQLIDVVSKNGNLLLNIGPKGDGSIPDEDQRILKQIGAWLKINGTAIYDSHIWKRAEEGNTRTKEGQFSDGEETIYQTNDYRFTAKGNKIYAFAMNYPDDGDCLIQTFKTAPKHQPAEYNGIIQDVKILGQSTVSPWFRDETGLHVKGERKTQDLPVVIEITVK
ncbi:MAG: alpha-L-fucosidase [Lachnospiraceae bacterium]